MNTKDIIKFYNKISQKNKVFKQDGNCLFVQGIESEENQMLEFEVERELILYLYDIILMILNKKTQRLIKLSKYETFVERKGFYGLQQIILVKGNRVIIQGTQQEVNTKFLENTKNQELLNDFEYLETIKKELL